MNDVMRLVRKLETIAESKSWSDQAEEDGDEYVDVGGFAGGNIDDAWQGGYDEGQIDLARELLQMIDPDYEPS